MSELRSMSFGTEAYHYAVMPDGEVIKNEDAFKSQMTNLEAAFMADLQNAWARKIREPRKETRK